MEAPAFQDRSVFVEKGPDQGAASLRQADMEDSSAFGRGIGSSGIGDIRVYGPAVAALGFGVACGAGVEYHSMPT